MNQCQAGGGLANMASLAKKGFDFADKVGIDEVPEGLGAVAGQFEQAFTSPNPVVTPATEPPGTMSALMNQMPQANTAEAVPPGMIMLTPDQLGAMIAAAASQGKQEGAALRRPK